MLTKLHTIQQKEPVLLCPCVFCFFLILEWVGDNDEEVHETVVFVVHQFLPRRRGGNHDDGVGW